MRNLKKIIFALLFFSIFFPFFSYAQEKIDFYGTKITINKDASLNIQETIRYDFGYSFRHGIFREIPISYFTKKGIYRLKIYNISAKNEKGDNYKIRKENKHNVLKLLIGDKNKIVSGKKTYIISYKVKKAINYFKDYDELYWNAIGFGWGVPIKKAEVKIILPFNIKPIKEKCFTGYKDETTQCSSKEVSKNYIKFSQKNLNPNQGITIAVALPKDGVSKPGFLLKCWYWVEDNMPFESVLFVFLIMFFLWWEKGRDEKGRGVIIPRFEIPEGLIPLEINTILKEKLLTRDITAEIIHLAIKGYLKVERIEKKVWFFKKTDYKLINLKKDQSPLKKSQKMLLNIIFKRKGNILTSEISRISTDDTLGEKILEKFIKNREKSERVEKIIFTIAALMVIIPILMGIFLNYYSSLSTYLVTIGEIILAVVLFLGNIPIPRDGKIFKKSINLNNIKNLQDLKKIIKIERKNNNEKKIDDLNILQEEVFKDSIKDEVFEKESEKIKKIIITSGILTAITIIYLGEFIVKTIGFFWMVSLILDVIIIIIFGVFMSKRTKKGSLLEEKILGLKRYLEVAEKARLEFHNAPEKNPQTFEKYLPYAIALGVEKKWAKQFKNIYQQPPNWYIGQAGQFSTLVFVNDLNSFSNAIGSSMASSGDSAFNGGGNAGGGFGGGGGGSW
ncbi:DUF2207 domain-containing protein [Desulfonauticus submarinus]